MTVSMGWLSRMGLFSVLLVASAFISTTASILIDDPDCDLKSLDNQTIKVDSIETFAHINVFNLNNATKLSCTWNITQKIGNTFFQLSRVALSPNDTLTVTGFKVDNIAKGDEGITNDTLFQSNGSPLPGLISTSQYSYVIVQLDVIQKTTQSRTFSSVYYADSKLIHLQNEAGIFSPLLNTNNKLIATNFSLQPDYEYSDRVIMLNFTQVPKDFKLTLNGVSYNNSANFFLQTTTEVNVEIQYTPVKNEVIQARFWLVTGGCSGQFQVSLGQNKSILFPDEDFRKQQQLTAIKCAQYFTTDEGNNFQVLIDKDIPGLANSGDSVNMYAADGTLDLGLNKYALMYFRTIDNFLQGSRYLVIYDSPFASNTDANFKNKVPKMKAIPAAQGQMFMLTETSSEVKIKLDGKDPVVHVLYGLVDAKNAIVEFPNITLKKDDVSISIFNSESSLGQPIVTLGQSNILPLAIPSNNPMMKIVYTGKIELTVKYRLVDPNSNCQYLSTFTPTFEVRGGQSNSSCSWYIPETTTAGSVVINPTILKVPKGKALTVTTFNKGDSKVDTYQGPISDFYFPDMFWNSASAYQFTLDSSNVAKDDLHLLIAKKDVYINKTTPILSTEKVSSISSANYPGYYPVGISENWMFMNPDNKSQEMVLITVEDVHLADSHSLSVVTSKTKVDFQGDANLTGTSDILVQYPFSLNLDASKLNKLTSPSNRGFNVDFQYPGIAEYFVPKAGDKPTEIVFHSAQNVTLKPVNIWQVTLADKSSSMSDNILRFNVTLAESLDKTKATLKVYDSISVRPSGKHLANSSFAGTSGSFVGSIKSTIIVYDYSASLATKTDFSINITVISEACSNNKNYTTKCHTVDRCITDEMICNGIDDCGDYTDELYCNGTRPSPPNPTPPAPSGGGVNTLVVIFVLMPMAAILGIVGYIYLPQFLLRIRRGRYSEFRDLSEVS